MLKNVHFKVKKNAKRMWFVFQSVKLCPNDRKTSNHGLSQAGSPFTEAAPEPAHMNENEAWKTLWKRHPLVIGLRTGKSTFFEK
jgi:hypothetical protein